MKNKAGNLLSWAAVSAVLIGLDQYTKALAVAHLKNQQPFIIWDGVFGLLQGRQGFFFLIGIVVLAAAGYAMIRMPGWQEKRYHWLKICVIMITAGAVGNMIDRITQGYVVDFLYFKLINFPIFNVADIFVTTATALLFVVLCFYYKEEELEIFSFSKKGEVH